MKPPSLRLVDVERAAELFLKKFNPSGKIPIPIEEIVELEMKIVIVVVPGIKKLLGIDAFISSDFTQITIDEYAFTTYPDRTKFSIAHEIGHLVLHANWYQTFGPKTLDDYFSFHDRIDAQTYKHIEIQASTFAGLILVPKNILLNTLKEKLGKIPIEENLEILIPVFQDLLDLFKVSGEVLLRRLQKEHIVKSNY
ncbi:ImmA/IrrE family metallo-endopeptidase [Candidatus Gottesmanbacteria bacterium]|nr:ImmA/IrrE family metallo-endopeptidase [Candidatus Gottesmanbacteria bacterium]